MVVQEKDKAKGGAIIGSQRSVGLGHLRLLRLPLGNPLGDEPRSTSRRDCVASPVRALRLL